MDISQDECEQFPVNLVSGEAHIILPKNVKSKSERQSSIDFIEKDSIFQHSSKNDFGYHFKDDVSKELICNFCNYTNFQKSSMKKHLTKNHTSKMDDQVVNTKFERRNSYEEFESSSKVQKKTNNSRISEENHGYLLKDRVSKELMCNFCDYTSFKKSSMKQHVKKNHASMMDPDPEALSIGDPIHSSSPNDDLNNNFFMKEGKFLNFLYRVSHTV